MLLQDFLWPLTFEITNMYNCKLHCRDLYFRKKSEFPDFSHFILNDVFITKKIVNKINIANVLNDSYNNKISIKDIFKMLMYNVWMFFLEIEKPALIQRKPQTSNKCKNSCLHLLSWNKLEYFLKKGKLLFEFLNATFQYSRTVNRRRKCK